MWIGTKGYGPDSSPIFSFVFLVTVIVVIAIITVILVVLHFVSCNNEEQSSYEGRSKSSEHHPERRAIAEHFCCGNTLPLLIKLEKVSQISLLCAGEAHAKVKGRATQLKMDKTEARAVLQYLQNKGVTHMEFHEDMVQTLAEDSPTYKTVKN